MFCKKHDVAIFVYTTGNLQEDVLSAGAVAKHGRWLGAQTRFLTLLKTTQKF